MPWPQSPAPEWHPPNRGGHGELPWGLRGVGGLGPCPPPHASPGKGFGPRPRHRRRRVSGTGAKTPRALAAESAKAREVDFTSPKSRAKPRFSLAWACEKRRRADRGFLCFLHLFLIFFLSWGGGVKFSNAAASPENSPPSCSRQRLGANPPCSKPSPPCPND